MSKTKRDLARAAAASVIAAGLALGATGCGYSQNWNTNNKLDETNTSTLNWEYR